MARDGCVIVLWILVTLSVLAKRDCEKHKLNKTYVIK